MQTAPNLNAKRIVTEHVFPPVPYRDQDWRATFDGYDEGDPMGTGPTKEAAIADLILQDEDGQSYTFA